MTTTRAPATTSRLLYLDNLRIALTALVVLHHAAITYGNIPLWYYNELAADPSGGALDVFVVMNQAFFMGFFFMISGFFTPGAHDRKGGRAFLRGRLIRLGIPLLLFVLVLRPLLTIGIYQHYVAAEGPLEYWTFYLASWDPGPLWFVEVLIVFGVAYALWRRGRARTAPAPAPTAPSAMAIALFTVGLAAVSVLWRLIVPTGTSIPVLGLPTPSFLPQYAGLFVVGTIAYRRGWFQALPVRAGWIGLASACAATVVAMPVVFMTTGAPASVALTVWESIFAVSVIIGLVVLFRERFSTQRATTRFLSEQAFGVYVFHPLVLVGLSYVLSGAFNGLHAPAVVKFAVVAVLALPLCWGLAYLVRQIPGAKRIF